MIVSSIIAILVDIVFYIHIRLGYYIIVIVIGIAIDLGRRENKGVDFQER